MTESESTERAGRSGLPLVVLGVVVVGAVLLVMLRGWAPLADRSVDGEPLLEALPLADVKQHPERPELEVRDGLDGVLEVASGAVVHIDRAAIVELGDRPVRIELGLPVPSETNDPRPVRLLVVGGQGVELESHPLSGSRDRVRIDLPADLLAEPGRYVVDVETTEKTHLPSRRIAIVVR